MWPSSGRGSAIKEAETDAMKRALMTFGNPFGLALYDKDQANVVDEPDERAVAQESASIADAMIEGLSKRQGADAVNAFLSHQKVAADIERLTSADRDRVMTVANGRRQVAAARAAS